MMSSQVRPSFFCTRPNGSLTPLLAVDDFPVGVTVRGVARTLTPSDTQGMISCGSAQPRPEPWILEGAAPAGRGAIATNEDLAELQNVLFKIMADDNVSTELRSAVKEILYRGLDASYVGNSTPANAMTGRKSTSPGYRGHAGNGKHGFNAKKEFCSYWIRHGECDYQQQGCLYKHEMPTDLSMLEKLGLRDIPRWYREKYGVPSLLQVGYGNQQRGQQQQAAIEQPQQRAIQFRPTINHMNNAGPSGNAGPAANAGSFTNAGPSGHAGPSHNAPASRTAGPSRNAGPSRIINAGSKKVDGNANGNHQGHAQPHGSIKGPNNANAAKDSHRNNMAAPSVSNDSNGTCSSASPSTSNSSPWSISPRGQQLLLATPMDRPLTISEVQGGYIMDAEALAASDSLAARLRALTTEGPDPAAEPVRNFFRATSRFNFGADGHLKGWKGKSAGFDPSANIAKPEMHKEATTSASTSMIGQLVATSEPIAPNEPLSYWGPIGEPVQRPAMHAPNAYTATHANSQAMNGYNAQFNDPFMGRH